VVKSGITITPFLVCSSMKRFATVESLGGIESLINHPWTMTHAAIPEKQRYDAVMTPGLIRL